MNEKGKEGRKYRMNGRMWVRKKKWSNGRKTKGLDQRKREEEIKKLKIGRRQGREIGVKERMKELTL